MSNLSLKGLRATLVASLDHKGV